MEMPSESTTIKEPEIIYEKENIEIVFEEVELTDFGKHAIIHVSNNTGKTIEYKITNIKFSKSEFDASVLIHHSVNDSKTLTESIPLGINDAEATGIFEFDFCWYPCDEPNFINNEKVVLYLKSGEIFHK